MSTPSPIARTPQPPYYAAIFVSTRTEGDRGYADTAARMIQLAGTMPGFIGIDSARGDDGLGITVSYWRTEEDIRRWKQNADHLRAQAAGRAEWYDDYSLHVAKVERAYSK